MLKSGWLHYLFMKKGHQMPQEQTGEVLRFAVAAPPYLTLRIHEDKFHICEGQACQCSINAENSCAFARRVNGPVLRVRRARSTFAEKGGEVYISASSASRPTFHSKFSSSFQLQFWQTKSLCDTKFFKERHGELRFEFWYVI